MATNVSRNLYVWISHILSIIKQIKSCHSGFDAFSGGHDDEAEDILQVEGYLGIDDQGRKVALDHLTEKI